jgi:hypothetical protein
MVRTATYRCFLSVAAAPRSYWHALHSLAHPAHAGAALLHQLIDINEISLKPWIFIGH